MTVNDADHRKRIPVKKGGRTRIISAALLFIVIVFVAACGKNNNSSGGAPTPDVNSASAGKEVLPPLDKEKIARGQAIYEKYCITCHGKNGVGENPSNPKALDEQGNYVAPPLDGSAHAWHHSDDDLADFIASGSPQNKRMKAWKDTLSANEIRDVIEYIKSLWGPQERKCQGPRHMEPGCFRGH